MDHATPFQLLPALGAAFEGGLFCGLTTEPDGTHHAVVLLPDAPAKRLNWADAMAWAEGLGNGAQLPTRHVAALLFANAKPQFEEAWHWTSETDVDDSSCAWFQLFCSGGQGSYRKSSEGRARAVRLIQLTA
jgi:hypothetical protein